MTSREETVRLAVEVLDRGGVVAVEGANGAGKTTLAAEIASASGVEVETGPRRDRLDGRSGEELQAESSAWLVERLSRGGPALLDRGWATVVVCGELYGRSPVPSELLDLVERLDSLVVVVVVSEVVARRRLRERAESVAGVEPDVVAWRRYLVEGESGEIEVSGDDWR